MKKFLVLILSVIAAFTAAISLTACGKVGSTVKFSVDGETYASVSTGGSEVIKMPADPQKDGYTFDGWFWDDGVWARPFTANSLLNEPLKSDMTVYAKFSVNHSHDFSKQVATEPYLKSAATCTAKAVYYYSCECGEKGAQTFEYGDKLPHEYNNSYICTNCSYKCKSDGLSFELSTDNNSYVCTGLGTFNGKILIIPAEYNGRPVTKIEEDAFLNATDITDVLIPDSVTEVGFNAFGGCSDITKMVLPFVGAYADGSGEEYFGYIFGAGSYNEQRQKMPSELKTIVLSVKVTKICDYAFYGCSSLRSITIPDSVTSIGSYAFDGCSLLTKIYYNGDVSNWVQINGLGNLMRSNMSLYINGELLTEAVIETATEIKSCAFHGCSSLTSVTIGDSVTSIGDRAFGSCDSLASITIPDSVTSIGYSAFVNCASLTTVAISNRVTSIDLGTFVNCTSLTSVTIPNSVTSIGDYAFHYCTSLANITIPDSVTSIGWYAFSGCKSLTDVTIPDSVTEICNSAFSYCASLTSVTIGSGVTSLNGSAFAGCRSLTNINVKNNNKSYKSIDGNLYSKDGKTLIQYAVGKTDTSFEIPDSVESVKGGAFSDCVSLEKIEVDKNNANFSSVDGILYDKDKTEIIFVPKGIKGNITIPDGVTNIGNFVFEDCASLTSITIPDSVTDIGNYVFEDCTSLTSINVNANNKNYKSIDGNLYSKDGKTLIQYAMGKTDISFTISEGVTGIAEYAFSGCTSLKNITIPNSVTSIGENVFRDCASLINITIPDGVISIGGGAFSGCTSLTSVTIPDSVTSIGAFAFSGCTSLISITIPDSVTNIGNQAFDNCSSLTSVSVPDSVTIIGNWSFAGCSSLLSINVNANNKNYKSIDGNLYSKDGKTLIQYAIGKTDISFAIPDSVTSIGDGAFWGCTSLTNITIPDSVTSIESRAFYGCTSLTSVEFNDSMKQWKAITKGYDWIFDVSSECVIHCADGDIG